MLTAKDPATPTSLPEILDFGCGLGRHTRHLSRCYQAPVLGVDVDTEASRAPRHVTPIV